jgi:hypothetical protein
MTRDLADYVNATNEQKSVKSTYLEPVPGALHLKPVLHPSDIDNNYKRCVNEYNDLIYEPVSGPAKNRPYPIDTKRTRKQCRFLFYMLIFLSVLVINDIAALLLLNAWKGDDFFLLFTHCYSFELENNL